MLSTVLSVEDTESKQIRQQAILMELTFFWERDNKYVDELSHVASHVASVLRKIKQDCINSNWGGKGGGFRLCGHGG